MKLFYSALIVLFFAACVQPKETTSAENGNEAAADDYSQLDKFLGSWTDAENAAEVISIAKIKNFDSAKVCMVNDGKTEVAFPYNVKEDKFRLHQPEYWVEILHDKEANQLLWKVIRFDESEGKVVRKYNFKSK